MGKRVVVSLPSEKSSSNRGILRGGGMKTRNIVTLAQLKRNIDIAIEINPEIGDWPVYQSFDGGLCPMSGEINAEKNSETLKPEKYWIDYDKNFVVLL